MSIIVIIKHHRLLQAPAHQKHFNNKTLCGAHSKQILMLMMMITLLPRANVCANTFSAALISRRDAFLRPQLRARFTICVIFAVSMCNPSGFKCPKNTVSRFTNFHTELSTSSSLSKSAAHEFKTQTEKYFSQLKSAETLKRQRMRIERRRKNKM